MQHKKATCLLATLSVLISFYCFLGCDFGKKSTEELINEHGGIILTIEMSAEDALYTLATNREDSLLMASIETAIARKDSSQSDFVTLFGECFNEVAPNGFRLAQLFENDRLPEIKQTVSNKKVLEVLRQEMNKTYDSTFQILSLRIQYFKDIQYPAVKKVEGSLRIQIELPAISDTMRIRKLLFEQGKLGFWETYDNTEVFEYLSIANQRIIYLDSIQKIILPKTNKLKNDKIVQDTSGDENNLSLLEKQKNSESLEMVTFKKQNPLFAILRPSVSDNGTLLSKTPVIGTSLVKDTTKINKWLNSYEIKELFPKDLKLLWASKPLMQNADYIQLIAIKTIGMDDLPVLDGKVIAKAKLDKGYSGLPEITVIMTDEGAMKWKMITRNNIGKQIAITLDNYVYSYPVVQSEISGGRSSITGDFTTAEAEDFVNVLISGSLPATIKLIHETLVRPSAVK